jgi:hypothetical protein
MAYTRYSWPCRTLEEKPRCERQVMPTLAQKAITCSWLSGTSAKAVKLAAGDGRRDAMLVTLVMFALDVNEI